GEGETRRGGDKERGRQGDNEENSPCPLVPLSPCPPLSAIITRLNFRVHCGDRTNQHQNILKQV
ncbi:hypothetical protein, partial [Scytonema hofmannii]